MSQKEDEIKVLLNVINQLKRNGGNDAVTNQLRGIVNTVNNKSGSIGNMSSIMNINGPNQYLSVGTEDIPSSHGILKYTHEIVETQDENDSGL